MFKKKRDYSLQISYTNLMKYWSYTLHSFLVNLLGVLLVTSLHLWDFAIWLIAPFFFYWVAMVLTTVRIDQRKTSTSAGIALSLVLGHFLVLAFSLVVTSLLGQWLGKILNNGVEMVELFFTNSMNSLTMGGLIAGVGSFFLVHFYFSRAKRQPASNTEAV